MTGLKADLPQQKRLALGRHADRFASVRQIMRPHFGELGEWYSVCIKHLAVRPPASVTNVSTATHAGL
jgi:hypothetical protein